MSSTNCQKGFTIFELLVVFVVLGIIAGSTVIFLGNAYRQFFALQEDSSIHAELSIQSQRIAKVVRGTTDVVAAANNDLSVYAYFSPNDTYVSLIPTENNRKKRAAPDVHSCRFRLHEQHENHVVHSDNKKTRHGSRPLGKLVSAPV